MRSSSRHTPAGHPAPVTPGAAPTAASSSSTAAAAATESTVTRRLSTAATALAVAAFSCALGMAAATVHEANVTEWLHATAAYRDLAVLIAAGAALLAWPMVGELAGHTTRRRSA